MGLPGVAHIAADRTVCHRAPALSAWQPRGQWAAQMARMTLRRAVANVANALAGAAGSCPCGVRVLDTLCRIVRHIIELAHGGLGHVLGKQVRCRIASRGHLAQFVASTHCLRLSRTNSALQASPANSELPGDYDGVVTDPARMNIAGYGMVAMTGGAI